MVSVCIVNWNGMGYLPRCLDSVFGQDYRGEIEIIIVDNSSTDGSLEYIQNLGNRVKLLKNSVNKGFSCAQNQAVRASKGEYLLFLNFDVCLEPNFISEMVKAIEDDSSAGMASGKLLKQINGERSKIIDSTGIVFKHCFMSPRGEWEEDAGQYDRFENLKVFGACGAAAFCKRAMLEDVACFNEFFDEDFINYVEDVDLSWRAQLRGWRCIYNPKAVAYHERGATRKNNNRLQREYLIYGFRNRYCSMIKNISRDYWKKNIFKIIGVELLFLLSPNDKITLSVKAQVLYSALKMAKKMLIKREFIQKRKKALNEEIDYFLSYNSLSLGKIIMQELNKRIENLIYKAYGKFKKCKDYLNLCWHN